MPITAAGIIDLEAMLVRVDTTAKKRVTARLYAKALAIQALAIKMAPLDEANLEKAIKVRPNTPGRIRNEAGRFVRQEIEVFIDMSMPIPKRPGKTIADYAYIMHEHLTPMGPLKLGELSQAKNDSNGGVQVGGGFLSRAVDQVAGSLQELLDFDIFD
jgi:hypothetical protein